LGGIGTVREAGITILETARELFGWDAAFINLVTEDLKTTFPVITYDTIDGKTIVVPPESSSTPPSPMARSVLQEGAKLLLFDSVNRSPHEEMRNFGDAERLSNSLMFAPIRTAGRTIGLLSIQSYKISAFSVHDLEVFQVLADHVGAALRRIQAEEDLRRKEAQLSDLVKENQILREQLSQRPLQHPEAFAGIVTESIRMRALFHQVEAVARSVQPVMISGETGVGKELLARAVHLASGRTGPFIPVNVAGVDDDFFSDTLFGHKRGAYTNAVTERRGFVETAAGGTLFLDEIGDLSLSSQVKLLRLLQEHEYYPIGSDTPRRSEARVVVATNQDLDALIAAGQFRKDLYYRLQAHNLRIPPLRERIDDIGPLLAHFVEEASIKLGLPTPRIPREIVTLLRQHDFPGNVRELEGIVYDAVAKATRGVLALEHFADKIITRKTADSTTLLLAREDSQPVTFGDKLPALKEIGDMLVTEALRRTGQNQSMAARLLGVTQQALNQRILAMKTGQRTPQRPRKPIKKAR
jgi:transcriptional regulator with GAF, ATPase, and Fis domain